MTNKDKICRICGDKAIGKNFGIVSCETCKTFFRRNATKINEFKCIYNEKCEINLETRKECRKCRLNKCFAIGMKKSWILNEEELKIRKNKIEENRKKRLKLSDVQKDFDSTTNQSIDSTIDSNSVETEILEIIEINDKNKEEINSTINEFINTFNINSDINVNSNNVNQIAPEFDLSVVPVIPKPITDYNNTFTESEGYLLTELLTGIQNIRPVITKVTSEATSFMEAFEVLTMKSIEVVPNVVNLCKNLKTFNSICDNDKISLLKYGVIEMEYVYSARNYCIKSNLWTIPMDSNNTAVLNLDLLKKSDELYIGHKRFLQNIVSKWDSDEVILDLFSAIVLFNPNRPHLMHRNLIKFQQNIYMHLLHRYLQLRYRSESEAKSRLLRLMESLNDLYLLNQKHIRNFSAKHRQYFSGLPLLQELYDLSSTPHNSLTFL